MALEDMIGKPESDAEADEVPVAEGGSLIAKKRRAVRRMFEAAKKGDWKAAAEGFRDAFEACDEYATSDEADDDEAEGLGYGASDEEA